MTELSIDEIRDMDTKEIQRTINDLEKEKTQAFTDSQPFPSDTTSPAEELKDIKKSIARCKTVLNERGPQVTPQ